MENRNGNLVLTRRSGESVIVSIGGEQIMEINVGEVIQGRCKLCFSAPRHVIICRKEILNREVAR